VVTQVAPAPAWEQADEPAWKQHRPLPQSLKPAEVAMPLQSVGSESPQLPPAEAQVDAGSAQVPLWQVWKFEQSSSVAHESPAPSAWSPDVGAELLVQAAAKARNKPQTT
jgi:hypothetical protein